MKLNFRNRIALFTATAAALTIGMVFLVVYHVVYKTAMNHLDNDIRLEKEELLQNLSWTDDSLFIGQLPEWEENEHQQIEVNPTFLQLVDAHGHLVFRTSNLHQGMLRYDLHLTQEIFFNSRIAKQHIRQGQFPILNQHQRVIGHLSIGISQTESNIVLHNLRNILWIAFPLLLAILFFASALAASKGIAPVQRLIQAAAGIHTANIDARLPLPENKDEIYQLATTINELLQRLENGVQREKQFTADASHEMRTPLTAIRGTLEVLVRKRREPAQYEAKISRVIDEVDRLHTMLDQLLQLARLESGRVPVKGSTIDLHTMFEGLRESFQDRLAHKNMILELVLPEPALVHSDPALLQIILDNLLDNAIKYGKNGGHIECRWQPQQHQLMIRDDGPGIPAERLPHIFDRFYRADDSRSSTVPGSGLGLSISSKLADLLGIRLSASSNEGLGTSFTLHF